ncbi:PAS domain-containing sensor histidine kinase [Hymenobacter latericus]|uniref:PAS domain-containing sensor histidine kinase n=1 Tax=Hymenobacter sp. YIM 151858-1 TaxID=2987688 RepID=UPI00222680DB|nr:PAS domain-containing protein [Hymenobacter sp. YIM 151858-1]UYZ59388.1 PAS domain-containing protein [Hymenobacter sp. YIM 151858-1]
MPPFNAALAPDLLPAFLAVSLAALHVVRPIYNEAGTEIVDFALEYVNPAGQRMTGLPEQPGGTLLTRFPSTTAAGILGYYRRTFESGELQSYEVNYQADGLDNYFRLQAQRSGAVLVVSFTDTSDQDRSPVEQALRESQAREQAILREVKHQRNELLRFVEQAPAAVAVYSGPEYRVELANAAALAIWGRSLAEVQGRPVFEVLPEAATPDVVAIFEQVYTTGVPHISTEQPTRIERYGRLETVYWNFVFQPQYRSDGSISGILTLGTEVTPQVLARQQAQELNQQLEAHVQQRTLEVQAARAEAERQRRQWEQLFRRAPAAICIFDGPELVFEFLNPVYQAMFPGRELLGKRLIDALSEFADHPLVAILRGVYETGQTFEGREVLVPLAHTTGGPVEDTYFDLTYQARYNEEGQIDGLITYAYDVTQRVMARREREMRQQQLNELFEQAPVAIAIFRGPQYVIEVANPAVCAIWGRTQQQAIGTPLFELLPEAAGQGFEQLLDAVMATGTPHIATELPSYIHRHGRRDLVYWNFVYQPLREQDNGRVAAVTVVATEVTDQVLARQQVHALNEELASINAALRTANDELHDTNAQLTRSNIDLDTFVYTASHDLKAPIANIEGILLALREQLPAAVQQDAWVAQLLDMLQTTVARFQNTIAQLTDVSKLQLAQAGPTEPVPLAAVVADVCHDLGPALQLSEARLTLDVAPDIVVSFHPANLRSIVYNLISNAIKYCSPKRPAQVSVQATRRPQAVVLTITDNGLGMSEQQLTQLFGLFQRLHTHVDGTGVGLYIVKRLVENAGGSITVASQPDVGTTFTVTFPA